MEIVIRAEKNHLSILVDGELQLGVQVHTGFLMSSSDFEEELEGLFEAIRGKVLDVVQKDNKEEAT